MKPTSIPFPWKCGQCRERAVKLVTVPYTIDINHDGRMYTVSISDLEVPRCERCGEIVMIDSADERITEMLRQQIGVLPPEEISRQRVALGLTQRELANLLGISERTLAYWESGLEIQSRACDRLLRLFFAMPEVRARLSEEALAS